MISNIEEEEQYHLEDDIEYHSLLSRAICNEYLLFLTDFFYEF